MTTFKYDFTTLNATDNFLWGVILEVNNATNHFLGYGLIATVFIVSSFVMIRRTQDIGKSLISSLHISTILSIILYYAGKTQGVVVLSDVFMLGLLTIEAIGLGLLYYFRSSN